MENSKNSELKNIINEIIIKIQNDVDIDTLKKIENIIYIVLYDYDIERKNTEVTVYQGDITKELLGRFLIAKKLKNCSDRTLKYYKNEILKAFDKINKNPLDVTVDDIRMHLLKRKIEDNVSDVTINNERRALSSFFQWLQAEDIRPSNPMLKIDGLKEKKKKKEAFTEYELELMRSKITDKKSRAIFEVLVSTWARVSEVAGIKLSEISDDEVLIHAKGNKDRIVFLTPKARIAVDDYLRERNDNNCYLFPKKSQNGTSKEWWKNKNYVDENNHVDKGTIESFVRNLGRKNGIKAHPHKFRRTGATMALKKGMPLLTVSKMLGHESIETTQIYLSLDESELKEAHVKYC